MDRSRFFAALRTRGSVVFGTSISQKQVEGTESVLDRAQARGTKTPHLAYILATTYHETAHTMQPIEEIGRGKGRKYGSPAGRFGKVYFGRGYVQLTWLENYVKASEKLGIDLVQNPERVIEPRIAADILFTGMEEGWFAGDAKGRHTLARYLNGEKPDYVGARRIINGTDKAAMIAAYAKAFERALREAGYVSQAPKPRPVPPVAPPAPIPAPKPVPVPPPSKPAPALARGFWAAVVAILKKLVRGGQ